MNRPRKPHTKQGNINRKQIRFVFIHICFFVYLRLGNITIFLIQILIFRLLCNPRSNVWMCERGNPVRARARVRDLQIGVRGRLRVRVLSSEHAHFENFRPPNLKRVLSTENSYSQSSSGLVRDAQCNSEQTSFWLVKTDREHVIALTHHFEQVQDFARS